MFKNEDLKEIVIIDFGISKIFKMRQRNLLDFQDTTVLQKYLLNYEIEIYAINPIFLVLECIFFNLLNFNSIMYEIFTGK